MRTSFDHVAIEGEDPVWGGRARVSKGQLAKRSTGLVERERVLWHEAVAKVFGLVQVPGRSMPAVITSTGRPELVAMRS